MNPGNKTTPASYLLLRRGDEVLLGRRCGTYYYNGWYSVPAGHVDEGELPIEALIREAKEETGLTLDHENINHVHTMYRVGIDETGNRADYFFEVNRWNGEPTICEKDKCDDLSWFSLDALPEKMMHHVQKALEYIENGEVYSELGLDNVVDNPTK